MSGLNRRSFLKFSAGAAVATPLLKNSLVAETSGASSNVNSNFADVGPEAEQKKLILPKALKHGSTIALTAPASPVSSWNVNECIKYFKSMGCSVVIGDTIAKQKFDNRYLSAPDKTRADEFMTFVKRQDIDAIVCGRGGYGVLRILDMLDYEAIRNNPKVIMGYSDITALLSAVNSQSGITAFHGPVGSSALDSFTKSNLTSLIFEKPKFTPIKIDVPEIEVINPGLAIGRLYGGNLTLASSLTGTRFDSGSEESILFFEDVSVNAYEIDRMLSHLALTRKFKTATGVIFGKFKNSNERRPFNPSRGYSIKEVITQIFKPYNIPVAIGFPFGHIVSKLAFPIGIKAEIDLNKKSITFLEKSVV